MSPWPRDQDWATGGERSIRSEGLKFKALRLRPVFNSSWVPGHSIPSPNVSPNTVLSCLQSCWAHCYPSWLRYGPYVSEQAGVVVHHCTYFEVPVSFKHQPRRSNCSSSHHMYVVVSFVPLDCGHLFLYPLGKYLNILIIIHIYILIQEKKINY